MEAGPQILAGISLPLIHGSELVNAITIPLFTGAIGYVINWTGVWGWQRSPSSPRRAPVASRRARRAR